MNTKQLIIFFMVIAIIAIQCNANAVFPRQENGGQEPAGGDDPSEKPSTDPAPNPTVPAPEPSPTPDPISSPEPSSPTPGSTPPSEPSPSTQPVVVTTQDVVPTSNPNTQPPLPSSDTPSETQSVATMSPTGVNEPNNNNGGNKTTYILIGIGAVAVVVCIIAVLFIRNKKNNKEEFNFTHQPTAVSYGNNNYQNEQPAYTQGYATAVNEGYDQYNNQDQYGQDQYANQGYDQGYAAPQDQYNNQGYDQGYAPQDQYNNQGYDQYNGQNQYGQGYDQTYPQPADDGQVVPGNQYTIRYDFKPSLDDEIELEPGNVVEIIEVYDDGWAKGKNLTYNTEGVFPVNRITGVDDSKKARYSSLPRPVQ